MGWQDRDYAKEYEHRVAGRPAAPYSAYRPTRSVVKILIAVNIGVYVLCIMTAGPGRPIQHSPLFQFAAMTTNGVLHGHVWRMVTADYLHWSTGHIFMNMLGLYFLGRPLEQIWGARKFFVVYTIAGILGSVFYLALDLAGWLAPGGVAAGASGCVLGLLGAAAVLFPHAEVYIYFLFPVKIRVVAVVLGALYVLNIFQSGSNAGGDACHLAGLAFGVWWAMKGEQWWGGYRRQVRAKPVRTPGFGQRIAQRRADAELVDRILSKVNTHGIASLTARERRALSEATDRQREDERRFGRADRL